jgi:hypothetical protein
MVARAWFNAHQEHCMSKGDPAKLDRIVAEARRAAAERDSGYRERALFRYNDSGGRGARRGRDHRRGDLRLVAEGHAAQVSAR